MIESCPCVWFRFRKRKLYRGRCTNEAWIYVELPELRTKALRRAVARRAMYDYYLPHGIGVQSFDLEELPNLKEKQRWMLATGTDGYWYDPENREDWR